MASSLSNHLNNFSEGIYKIKCEHGNSEKKLNVKSNIIITIVFLNIQTLKMV